MDRELFLRAMRDNAVKLHPVTLPGWPGPVYLKPLTLGEVQLRLLDESPTDTLKTDPLHMARNMAGLVHDESGQPLFDPKDDAQMRALHEAMSNAPTELMRILQDEFSKLTAPTADEVDASGN